MKKLLPLLLSLGLCLGLRAQTTNAPRTYFDAYFAVPNALLLRGMSTIGTLSAQITYPVEVRAERLQNAQNSNVVYAVCLRTRGSGEVQVDYIDYDELDGLIRGVQMISQANNSVTPLDNFQAVYRTRSGLVVSKLSVGNKVVISMTSGDVNGQRNQMAAYVLDDLGKFLASGKARLDALGSSGP
jgi:hypothetical protein